MAKFHRNVIDGSPVMIETDADCITVDLELAYVIDDDAQVRQFVSATLSQLGMTTETFEDGKDALAALEAMHPAVIFLDVALLQSDALDVIRGLGKANFCGIVQLMSGGRASLLDAVKRIGERHHMRLAVPLQKPFEPDAIVQLVAGLRIANRSRSTEESLAEAVLPLGGR